MTEIYRTCKGTIYSLLVLLVFVVTNASALGQASAPAPASSHAPAREVISKRSTGALTHMQVKTQSRSLILRATHILLVKIVSAKPHKWTAREAGGEERVVSLELKLTKAIKGQIDQKASDVIKIEVKQVKLGFAWGAMPGAWSQVDVDVDTQLTAFVVGESTDAQTLLNDPSVVELIAADDARTDVLLAAQADDLGLTKILAKAKSEAGTLGHLFADFLWASYADEVLSDFSNYEQILQALEWPELSTVARSTLLMTIPDSVLAPEPVNLRQVDRLAVTMVRILNMSSAKVLHDNIVSTFLPNLVDAANPESRSPESVFADYPKEGEKLAKVIKAYAGNPAVKDLVAWAKR